MLGAGPELDWPRRPRNWLYDEVVRQALIVLWEASGQRATIDRPARLVGYGRLSGLTATQPLAQLYAASRLFINFFQPSFKVKSKARDGARLADDVGHARLGEVHRALLLSIAEDGDAGVHAHAPGHQRVALEQLNAGLDDRRFEGVAGAWRAQGGRLEPTRAGLRKDGGRS